MRHKAVITITEIPNFVEVTRSGGAFEFVPGQPAFDWKITKASVLIMANNGETCEIPEVHIGSGRAPSFDTAEWQARFALDLWTKATRIEVDL